jgi:hypothetical protein
MTVSSRHRPVIPHASPALSVLIALHWVAVILGCSRRERARRFLALVLPKETDQVGQKTSP